MSTPSHNSSFDSPQHPKSQDIPIYLNTYNIIIHDKVVPLYHTGIEVFNTEYSFCFDAGVIRHDPGDAFGVKHYTRDRIGIVQNLSELDVMSIVMDIVEKAGFRGEDYHLLNRNCNHFTELFARHLLSDDQFSLPSWVNQAANFGSYFERLIPERWCRPVIGVEEEGKEQDKKQSYLHTIASYFRSKSDEG